MLGASDILNAFYQLVAGPESRLWPYYLATSVLIAFAAYRARKIKIPFAKWLFPEEIYLHASHMIDLKVFGFSLILHALGLFNLVFFASFIADQLSSFQITRFGVEPFPELLVAIILLCVLDFAIYWVHRVHHESRIFWPFHSLHHSAEVMTPVTVYRKHPIYDVISIFTKGVLIGLLQGVFLLVFASETAYSTIAGVNAAYFAFYMAGANLRHSHVWISFGSFFEHLFISPAQHQIHHSIDPKHHNKNYGEVLAIWDWMFGTLYIPKNEEIIEFGLGNARGERTRQRHDTLKNAMLVPIQDSWKQIIKKFAKFSSEKSDTDRLAR